jgi:hypothetical protein
LRERYRAGDERERFAVLHIFLSKLFACEGLRMVHEPEVRIRPEIAAYEMVGLVVEVSG